MIQINKTLFLSNDGFELRPISWTRDWLLKMCGGYMWYAEFFNGNSLKNLRNADVLSSSMLSLIKNKRCKLILNNAHEAFHDVVWFIYEIVIKELAIPPEQVILISESAIINKEVEKIAEEFKLPKIKTMWVRALEHSLHNTQRVYNRLETLSDKKYNKKFLNLNRRWRMHRPTFVALLELNNLLEQGYVSLAKADDNGDWDKFMGFAHTFFETDIKFKEMFINNEHRISQIPHLILDQQDMTFNHAQTFTPLLDSYYENTYFSIVTETTFFKEFGEGIFLTEKTFKPIMHRHPFVILSRPHTLKTLRHIGYKTFDGIINESYDNEENDITRMMMVVEETKRLCSLDEHQLNTFLMEARHIVDYNYNILREKETFLTEL